MLTAKPLKQGMTVYLCITDCMGQSKGKGWLYRELIGSHRKSVRSPISTTKAGGDAGSCDMEGLHWKVNDGREFKGRQEWFREGCKGTSSVI
jgi:hypothetical protein